MSEQNDLMNEPSESNKQYDPPQVLDMGKAEELFLGWFTENPDSSKGSSKHCF